jgi:hypothetical protein
MGNSRGGILLLGVAEQRDVNGPTGAPDLDAPLGLECDNPEQMLTASEARILDAIDQRLSVESHAIALESGRKVLGFQVSNSIDKPHRVSYQGRTSFPARRERQRYELNAAEIKDMVMRTASRIDEVEEEILRALSREVDEHEYPTLTVALIPVFTRNFAFDFRRQDVVDALARMDLIAQGRNDYIQPNFGLDGLSRRGMAGGTNVSLSHNGLVRLTVKMPGLTNEAIRSFNPLTADLYIRGIARGCEPIFATANLNAPALLGVALHVPHEAITNYGNGFFDGGNQVQPFSKIYPSLLLESIGAAVDPQIRPLCDLLHQSFGEPHSSAFDENGNWIHAFRF